MRQEQHDSKDSNSERKGHRDASAARVASAHLAVPSHQPHIPHEPRIIQLQNLDRCFALRLHEVVEVGSVVLLRDGGAEGAGHDLPDQPEPLRLTAMIVTMCDVS